MSNNDRDRYRVREFAALTGVTVRTLHHYDRIGLLRPGARTASGYRLYGRDDLVRLQQIVTLKFLGLSLNEIKELLERKRLDLAATLRMQREVLAGRREQIDRALSAIAQAESSMAAGREPGFETLRIVMEVIEMQQKWEFAKQYYSPEAREKLDERARNFTPEMQQQVQQQWADLIREVEAAAAAGEDAGSAHAQSLAERWSKLIQGFTGGDPEIAAGLSRLYQDQQNWPAGVQKPYSDTAGAFICQAIAARRK